MRTFYQGAAAIALACIVSTGAAAQGSPRNKRFEPLTGRLFLTVELKGQGRKDLSNKVEWYRLTADRKLELELAMYMPVKSPAPTLTVGGIDKDNAPMPAGMEAIKNAVEGCNGDQNCERQAMAAVAQKMMANPGTLAAMQPDDTRFENWFADRRGPCATGTLNVEDEGDGMNISPPAPAKPYRFKRSGRLELAAQGADIMDRACKAEISVDRQKGLLSMRLGGFNIPVPVQMTGQAYTAEKSVLFLEGSKGIELFDQAVSTDATTWSGQSQLEKIGSVSHNSGQTVAPMAGKLTWRFVRD